MAEQPAAKATLELDGQDLEIISRALSEKSFQLSQADKPFEASHHAMLAAKVMLTKREFHERHKAAFAKRYELENEKKPAAE